jgi:hypothetical protein
MCGTSYFVLPLSIYFRRRAREKAVVLVNVNIRYVKINRESKADKHAGNNFVFTKSDVSVSQN